ncbi:MAG TPA: cytochrome d ubiquinol oxidase subunit II [Pseudonocardiaceae bacterium]|nr:cytochrome d ubiquinol oxidase subunit II [Pseudonocardiaceae bacterium]
MVQGFWLVLLGLFAAGYFVLEGADFGAGMVLAVLGRGDRSGRDDVVRAIAPRFLGNEVWMVATIGVVDGAFPKVGELLLGRGYPALIAILLGWLVRDAGLWFRRRGDATWRWDLAIGVASVVLAGGWGVLWGRLLGVGITLQALSAVALAGLCVVHGLAFLGRLPRGRAATFAVTSLVLASAPLLVGWAAFPAVSVSAPTLNALTPLVIGALPVLAVGQVGLWWLGRTPMRSYF